MTAALRGGAAAGCDLRPALLQHDRCGPVALDGPGCQVGDAGVASYRWVRTAGDLRFFVVSDTCMAQQVLFILPTVGQVIVITQVGWD